jgi:hypothetical protein
MGEAVGLKAGASDAGTAYAVEGLIRDTAVAGSTTPILYVPAIPPGSGLRALHRRHEFLYGRIVSDVSLETVQGEENDSEMVRIATIAIREEV